jgi:hypothetical protein
MGVIVTFNYASWIACFPEFTNVTQDAAACYFNLATLYNRNDGGGPVCDATVQSELLNLMTAHIAWLYSPQLNGQPNTAGTTPASPLVGRINTATEGSVSVGAELDMPAGIPQFYAQTKYGLAWWVATAAYRTFRYLPGLRSRRVFNPYFQVVQLR